MANVGKRLRRDRTTLFFGAVLLSVFLSAIFAPLLAPADPYETSMLNRLKPIGTPGFPLGADKRKQEAPLFGDPPTPIDPPPGCRFNPRCRLRRRSAAGSNHSSAACRMRRITNPPATWRYPARVIPRRRFAGSRPTPRNPVSRRTSDVNEDVKNALRASATTLQSIDLADDDLAAILPRFAENASLVARLAAHRL